MTSLVESLTAAQREAVEQVDGPLLILAGPGSGKTRVITHRIAYLLEQGTAASRILALTFTNKAADEMRTRLEVLAPGKSVWVSTFHRFCSRLLRRYGTMVGLSENFTIYDTNDSAKVLSRTLEELGRPLLHIKPEAVASVISRLKNRLVTPETFQPRSGDPLEAIVAEVYPVYQARLLASSAVDFDDLLAHVANLLRENAELRATLDERYQYVLVDEYQDTNLAQYAIVRALSIDHPNLAVTGDPDQSIYSWRGANLSNILEFESDFPDAKVVRLEQNYRSTKSILHVADCLIQHNQKRKPKALFTGNDDGPPVRLKMYADQRAEARAIAARIAAETHSGSYRPRDFAVFYRINALSRILEDALRAEGIPYQVIRGLEFYQRKEIKDIVAYLRLINNPRDDVALLRVINTPVRGIGKKTINHLQQHANRYGQPLLDASRECGLIEAITKRAAAGVMKFVAMQDRLREVATSPVEEILGHVLEESGYQNSLKESGLAEDEERLANILELLTAARQFDEENPGEGHLEEFLETTALAGETDEMETERDKVTLMSLHAAKGLEFPVVFVIALEEGLLPHERSAKSPDQLEEERRLLFVGITRAERELQLSLVKEREFRGRRRRAVASSFLYELPRDTMDVDLGTATYSAYASPSVPTPQPGTTVSTSGQLTTAAEMLDSLPISSAAAAAPDDFYQGMNVKHPKFGLGKVIALSGEGAKRKATINFAAAGQQKFIIAESPLQPVGRRNGK